MDLPERKKNRMSGYDYSLCGAYFVTICVKNKEQLLWRNAETIVRVEEIILTDYGRIVEKYINEINFCYSCVSVSKYVIMPDHIHLIVCISPSVEQYEKGRLVAAPTLSNVIGQMKRAVSKEIGFSIWQKTFYDHIIRDERDYMEVCKYIDENPMKYICSCNL